jgi:hypothetical protein
MFVAWPHPHRFATRRNDRVTEFHPKKVHSTSQGCHATSLVVVVTDLPLIVTKFLFLNDIRIIKLAYNKGGRK